MNGKQVCKILHQNGWTLKRINGSHHIYGKPGQPPVAVPVHGKTDLGKGLLLTTQKQNGSEIDLTEENRFNEIQRIRINL